MFKRLSILREPINLAQESKELRTTCKPILVMLLDADADLSSLGRSSGNGTFGIQTILLKGITFENDYKLTGAPRGTSGQAVVHVASGEQWTCE